MKRSRISLDFTSLLDIMMIILFFFILNFNNAQAEAYQKIDDYNNQAEQLEADKQQFEKEKEEWQKQADAELEKMREADKKAADNAEALINFQKGVFFKIDLKMESETEWKINIFNGDILISELSSDVFGNINSFDIKNELITILDENGFEDDDVIICIFMYDPGDKGTSRITDKGNLIEKIKSVGKDKYENFYCADIKK